MPTCTRADPAYMLTRLVPVYNSSPKSPSCVYGCLPIEGGIPQQTECTITLDVCGNRHKTLTGSVYEGDFHLLWSKGHCGTNTLHKQSMSIGFYRVCQLSIHLINRRKTACGEEKGIPHIHDYRMGNPLGVYRPEALQGGVRGQPIQALTSGQWRLWRGSPYSNEST